MVLDAVPLVAVTGLFIGIFSYSIIRLQLEEIRNNWQERRCDPFVIPLAHMIPTDPDVDTAQFSVENFQYCTNKLVDASIALVAAPMQKGFMAQIDAIKPINTGINYLRSNALSLLSPLNTLINGLWQKVMVIVYQFARIFMKFSSAFDRIFGIAISSIFAGIGLYRSIRNAMNFVVYVVLIILLVLLIIVIFLFFLLIPVMPVILTTIGVLSASIFGASVGGMADSFCVAPGTLVAVKEGWKKVEELRPGDELREGIVEGILKATGTSESLVRIDGIIIASCHIIKFGDTWMHAEHHPLAQPYTASVSELYCLNTSTRTWTVKGSSHEYVLRDWEELPLDPSLNISAEWESLIYSFLNTTSTSSIPTIPRIAVPGRGLLGKNCYVFEKVKGSIPVSSVKLGDSILESPGIFTKVLALYQDIDRVPRSGINHAAWVWDPQSKIWTHPVHYSEEKKSHGYHLITKSGKFMINSNTYVRDFTEVGLDALDQTYSFVLSQLSSLN